MKYLVVIFMLVLAGCGAGSDSGENATLPGMVGTWDDTEQIGPTKM